MLIERQVAPALVIIGATLATPEAVGAIRGTVAEPSVGLLIAGDLVGALGLFMGILTFLDADSGWLRRAIVLLCFGALALLFAGGTAWAALQVGGARGALAGIAALAPLAATGYGAHAALKP
jgi:hypothetical protein